MPAMLIPPLTDAELREAETRIAAAQRLSRSSGITGVSEFERMVAEIRDSRGRAARCKAHLERALKASDPRYFVRLALGELTNSEV
jgi:uncharacterized protein YbjT (DUF2867 family)